jgi:hypothetical protein
VIYVDLLTSILTDQRGPRSAHNPKVVGSSPTPATKKSYLLAGFVYRESCFHFVRNAII